MQIEKNVVPELARIQKIADLISALSRAEAQLSNKIRICRDADRMMNLVEARKYANRILNTYKQYDDIPDHYVTLAEGIIGIANQKERAD